MTALTSTTCIDRLFIQWNNTVYQMNYWVPTGGRYRAISILGRVHATIKTIIYMPDEIVLARMITVLDIEFKKAMHYHYEGYESDNDYGLPPQIMRPVCIYSVFTTEASFNLAEYKVRQYTISPFIPRWPRSLPFPEGVCQHITFDGIPQPIPVVDSDDEGYILTVDLDDPVWSEEPAPDSWEYLCIQEIPRPTTPLHSLIKECQ